LFSLAIVGTFYVNLFHLMPPADIPVRSGPVFVGYMNAFNCGILTALVLVRGYLCPQGTEFCENGIIFEGILFYRWDALRYIRWNPESGKLGLDTGLSPVYLTIPPEYREHVAEIVRAKKPAEVTTHHSSVASPAN
jgi:hypothetical protein